MLLSCSTHVSYLRIKKCSIIPFDFLLSPQSTSIPQNDGPLPIMLVSLKKKKQNKHRNNASCKGSRNIPQLDGPPPGGDSSSEESDDSSESEAEDEPEGVSVTSTTNLLLIYKPLRNLHFVIVGGYSLPHCDIVCNKPYG